MAVQAPFRLQRVLRVHQRHLVDAPMAACAANALVHMDGVIEVDKIRKVVNLGPDKAFAGGPAVPHRLQQLGVGPDLRVTVHAGARGRNAGVARFLHCGVTVLALQAEALNVMLVAEGNRLLSALALPRDPRRALQLVERDPQSDDDQPRQHQAHASQCIGAAVEDLRHERIPV